MSCPVLSCPVLSSVIESLPLCSDVLSEAGLEAGQSHVTILALLAARPRREASSASLSRLPAVHSPWAASDDEYILEEAALRLQALNARGKSLKTGSDGGRGRGTSARSAAHLVSRSLHQCSAHHDHGNLPHDAHDAASRYQQ